MSLSLAPIRRAFTLIELMLVISIIAILVSITIPALGSSRETARRVKCLGNLRGLGQGMANYLNDSKDLLPRVRPLHDPAGNTNDPSLLDIMTIYLSVPAPEHEDPSDTNSPYIHVADSFRCPSDRTGRDSATNFEPAWRTNGTSYEYLAGGLMWGAEQLLLPDPQGGVSTLYKQPQWKDLAVLLDNDNWHPLRRTGPARNALYYGDWRADWAGGISRFDSQDPALRRLLCDLSRFCGRPLPGCN